jgi:hypothetical protein
MTLKSAYKYMLFASLLRTVDMYRPITDIRDTVWMHWCVTGVLGLVLAYNHLRDVD